MRSTAYVAVLASFLAVLLALATAPAAAEMKSGPMMDHTGITGQDIGKTAGQGQTEFSGEARSGAQQERARHEREMKSGMEGRGEIGVAPESRPGMTGEMKGKLEGQTRDEMRMKPEARPPAEGEAPGQARGGQAVVARVDRPDNCLRVRSGPGSSYDRIGCAAEGETLRLTGVFSKDGRWAQLDNNGWVFFRQLQTDIRPPQAMASERSFEQPAAAGKKEPRKGYKRHHRYGGPHYYYYEPGYYGYGCPGYSYGYHGGMYWYP